MNNGQIAEQLNDQEQNQQAGDIADLAPRQLRAVRDGRQKGMLEWAANTWGEDAHDPRMRAARFLEEALELYQAVYGGAGRALAEAILNRVYSRPVGDPAKEVGGAAVTLGTLAESLNVSVDERELEEINRVVRIDRADLQAREAAKVAAGLIPN